MNEYAMVFYLVLTRNFGDSNQMIARKNTFKLNTNGSWKQFSTVLIFRLQMTVELRMKMMEHSEREKTVKGSINVATRMC